MKKTSPSRRATVASVMEDEYLHTHTHTPQPVRDYFHRRMNPDGSWLTEGRGTTSRGRSPEIWSTTAAP